MKTFILSIVLMASTATHAAIPNNCISQAEAVQNVMAFLTARDFIEVDWSESDVDEQRIPAIAGAMSIIDSGNDTQRIRFYAADVKRNFANIKAELTRDLQMTSGSHALGRVYLAQYSKESEVNSVLVDCIGNVQFYSEYAGPM